MVSVKLFVEGGGSRALNRACRRGFGKFIERAGAKGTRVVACGSRGNAYRRFRAEYGRQSEAAMLLVDAEGPVTAPGSWQHLSASDRWDRPGGATDNQCHLMVQVMESWFLADADTLDSFYDRGFRRQALPPNPYIEQIPKQDVLNGLARATRDTRKGPYKKGARSFEILVMLDPAKVRNASPQADRFIRALSG